MIQMKWSLLVFFVVTLLVALIACSEVRDIEMGLLNDSRLEDSYDSTVENTSPVVNHLDFNSAMMKVFIPGLAWSSLLAMSSYLIVTTLSTYEGRMFVFVGLSGYALLCVAVLLLVACLEKVGIIPTDDQV